MLSWLPHVANADAADADGDADDALPKGAAQEFSRVPVLCGSVLAGGFGFQFVWGNVNTAVIIIAVSLSRLPALVVVGGAPGGGGMYPFRSSLFRRNAPRVYSNVYLIFSWGNSSPLPRCLLGVFRN